MILFIIAILLAVVAGIIWAKSTLFIDGLKEDAWQFEKAYRSRTNEFSGDGFFYNGVYFKRRQELVC